MKKLFSAAIVICILMGSLTIESWAEGVVMSPQNLTVDGKSASCEAYNIDGNNYFKLRDIAKLLDGTGSQFEIGWDAVSSTISIETGKSYTPNGSELATGEDKSDSAVVSRQSVQIDGKTYSDLVAYNIGGNNFFKLRDLGGVLGFDVSYDQTTNTVSVTSRKAVSVSVPLIGHDYGPMTVYSYYSSGKFWKQIQFTSFIFTKIEPAATSGKYKFHYTAHGATSGDDSVGVYLFLFDDTGNILDKVPSFIRGGSDSPFDTEQYFLVDSDAAEQADRIGFYSYSGEEAAAGLRDFSATTKDSGGSGNSGGSGSMGSSGGSGDSGNSGSSGGSGSSGSSGSSENSGSSVDDDPFCPTCDGLGDCPKCYGSGDDYCTCLFGRCPNCAGQGTIKSYSGGKVKERTCSSCHGTGEHAKCGGTGYLTCSRCHGDGVCPTCHGTGLKPGRTL